MLTMRTTVAGSTSGTRGREGQILHRLVKYTLVAMRPSRSPGLSLPKRGPETKAQRRPPEAVSDEVLERRSPSPKTRSNDGHAFVEEPESDEGYTFSGPVSGFKLKKRAGKKHTG